MSADLELNRWLDRATRGVPRESRGWIRAELQAHYEDAVQEQRGRGADLLEAHCVALAELGSAQAICGDLRETHLAERRFRVAAAASLIFPLTMLAHVALRAQGGGIDVVLYDLLLLLPMLYILRMLNTLLVQRFNLHVERRIGVVALGLLAMTIPEIVMGGYWFALRQGIGFQLSALGYGALNTLLLVDLIGAVVLGIGLVWLAESLLRLKHERAGILRPFCIVGVVTGYALALTSAASVVGQHVLFDAAWLVALILGVILHALWTLMFVRAAQPSRPALAV